MALDPLRNIRRMLRKKLKLIGAKNFITLARARKMGYREAFVAWLGMGDNIVLLGAAQQYFKLTGAKPLLIVSRPDFFINSRCCHVLSDVSASDILDMPPGEIPAGGPDIRFADCCDIDASGRTYWGDTHMIARTLEHMGVGGDMEIAPHLELTDKEKKRGRFAAKHRKQICVMSGGLSPYKRLPVKTTQAVVDALSGDHDIVQIGARGDAPLENTLNLSGKTTLRQSAAVLFNADLFVGTIGGLMHVARAVGCPSVIAFSCEPLEYAKYTTNAYVFSDTPCDICSSGQLTELPGTCAMDYKCVRNIHPQKIVDACVKMLREPPCPQKQIVRIHPEPCDGLEKLNLWKKRRARLSGKT